MDSTTQNSERKDTYVSFHKAKISETFDKNPSSVDLNLTPVFSRFRVALYFFLSVNCFEGIFPLLCRHSAFLI